MAFTSEACCLKACDPRGKPSVFLVDKDAPALGGSGAVNGRTGCGCPVPSAPVES